MVKTKVKEEKAKKEKVKDKTTKKKTKDKVLVKETKKKVLEEETEPLVKEEEKIEKASKESKLLVPLEDYLKAGIHIGMKIITADMRSYVYRRKADGLAVLNTEKIDNKLRAGAAFLALYDPKDIILVCKRDAGWKAAEAFSRATGIRTFTKKYPAGVITNPLLEDFFEPSLLLIVDPWLDKNALIDAVKVKIPIVGLCDTNNLTSNIDLVMPCNNKSAKSIGLALFILAKLYAKKRGIKAKLKKEDFYKEENI